MVGDTRLLSATIASSTTKAALGAELGVEDVVTHGLEPVTVVTDQPAGKAGAVTPSKFSEKDIPATEFAVELKLTEVPGQIGPVVLFDAVTPVGLWFTVTTVAEEVLLQPSAVTVTV